MQGPPLIGPFHKGVPQSFRRKISSCLVKIILARHLETEVMRLGDLRFFQDEGMVLALLQSAEINLICAGILDVPPNTFRRLTLDNASVSVARIAGGSARLIELNNKSFVSTSVRAQVLSEA